MPGKLWTARELKLLGRRSDNDLAQKLLRTAKAVSAKREKLGIPPFYAPNGRRNWSEAEDRLLGTAPDKEIALRLNRSTFSIEVRRSGLKIKAFSRRPWMRFDENSEPLPHNWVVPQPK